MKVKYPSGNVLARNLDRTYSVIERGFRHKLWDQEGREIIDAVSGMLVVSLGHGHPGIQEALQKAASKIDYVNGMHFTTAATEELASMLAKHGQALGLTRSAFLASGSEATEAALKMARQIWFDRGLPQKTKFIARTPGYHGNTLFGLSVSARPHYKKVYGPLLHPITFVDAPYPYRSKVEDYARDGGKYYADLIEAAILNEGSDQVAALIMEPVVGSSAGASVPPPGYMARVQEICARHQVLIIADEVMCGAHRAGSFFASTDLGLRPDILTLGKGIGAGFFPLSVVMTKQSYVDEFKAASGGFAHAQTFMMHPLASAVGCAVLRTMEAEQVGANVGALSESLIGGIKKRLADVPHVGSVQGKGFMLGIELVADRATKRPFDRAKKVAERLVSYGLDQGVTLWPNVGHADGGVSGDLVMVGPPLNSTPAEIQEIVDRVCAVIEGFTP